MLASIDQVQQLCCPLFQAVWKKRKQAGAMGSLRSTSAILLFSRCSIFTSHALRSAKRSRADADTANGPYGSRIDSRFQRPIERADANSLAAAPDPRENISAKAITTSGRYGCAKTMPRSSHFYHLHLTHISARRFAIQLRLERFTGSLVMIILCGINTESLRTLGYGNRTTTPQCRRAARRNGQSSPLLHPGQPQRLTGPD